jgi:hypothetical protein
LAETLAAVAHERLADLVFIAQPRGLPAERRSAEAQAGDGHASAAELRELHSA